MTALFGWIRDYFSSAFLELRKVVWPTRREVIRNTLVITVSVVVAVILLGLIDFGLTTILKFAVLKR